MCARAEGPDLAAARVERALAQIGLRLGDSAREPGDIAHQQGVCRRYLDGVLRQVTGGTLATHIRTRRLERAAHDLEPRPHDLAAEIATRWGFVDASHFARRFRAHYGVTPTGYRARLRRNLAEDVFSVSAGGSTRAVIQLGAPVGSCG